MIRLFAAAMLALIVAGCGSAESTAITLTRTEIITPDGHRLDCPDDLVAGSILDVDQEDGGWSTPVSAVEAYDAYLANDGSFAPATGSSTAFVLSDESGNRLAWVNTAQMPNGWFVVESEECGSIPNVAQDEPSGPCIDRPDDIGDIDVFASARDSEVAAALNFVEVGRCPRLGGGATGYNADGFLLGLDDTLLFLQPQETLTIRAPGYLAAELSTNWEIGISTTGGEGGQVWELLAPDEPGSYQVDLRLTWAEGRSHYAVLVDVVSP